MKPEPLTKDERDCLLQLARQSLTRGVTGGDIPGIDLQSLPPRLRQPGATFVTLTEEGQLRGCIGALDAYQSIAEDVCEHAEAAALRDYRFPPVSSCELEDIHIEISYLTPPELLAYDNAEDLIRRLRPGIDGVLIRDGYRRATFLPQVWEKLPDPAVFLGHLCAKMGAPTNLWQRKHLDVFVYQVESFAEEPRRPFGEVSPN